MKHLIFLIIGNFKVKCSFKLLVPEDSISTIAIIQQINYKYIFNYYRNIEFIPFLNDKLPKIGKLPMVKKYYAIHFQKENF